MRAQRMIKHAVQAELDTFLNTHEDTDAAGRRAVVRNGYQPEREILTGLGPVPVALPKTRDRGGLGRRFSSALLPPYLKKTQRVEAVLPWLYLKGVSTHDFDDALQALFGESVKGLSASTISRLKTGWKGEYDAFRERDWRGHERVYLGADGIYINVRAADDRFVEAYPAKYPKATACLEKDRPELLALYAFPAAHWQDLRTSNPIESTFATIRLRTASTRHCVSAQSGLKWVYQLAMSAQKGWRRIRGFKQLADVIDGIDERELAKKAA